MPMFGEVKDRLINEFDCRYKLEGIDVHYQDGDVKKGGYFFERDTPSGTIQYAVSMADYERIDPISIRSLCRALGIKLSKFGLYLE